MIDLRLTLELLLLHVLPGSLLDDLATETILDGTVDQSEVDAPLGCISLSGVLLVPHSEESLVGQVHLFVHIARPVVREVIPLHKLVVDGGKRLLSKFVVEVGVDQVVVVVELAIDVRAVLHELRLGVPVGDFAGVQALVEVHIPIDSDVVRTWDVSPIFFISLGQL